MKISNMQTLSLIWCTNIGLFHYILINKKENGYLFFSHVKTLGTFVENGELKGNYAVMQTNVKRRIRVDKDGKEFIKFHGVFNHLNNTITRNGKLFYI